MMLTLQNTNNTVQSSAIHDAEHPSMICEVSRGDFEQPQAVAIQRKFFSYAGQDLRLDTELEADFFLQAGVAQIRGWGIEMQHGVNNFNLDREIIRKFLTLFSKATTDTLTGVEREQWAFIIDQVDYQRFCTERSPAVYVEGTLASRDRNGWRVVWHDGSEQLVATAVGQPLSLLNPGEMFCAMVKFGQNREPQKIDQLTFLVEPTKINSDLWESWTTSDS